MKGLSISIVSIFCFIGVFAQTESSKNVFVSQTTSLSTNTGSNSYATYSEQDLPISSSNTFNNINKEDNISTPRKRILIEAVSTETPVTVVNKIIKKVALLENESTNATRTNSLSSNNNFKVTYSLLKDGAFKYAFHIEGSVKDCAAETKIPHAYISVNSAIYKDRFQIIPTNVDGSFSLDITDDSIGSITIIKKGYEDKQFDLNTTLINEYTAYGFEVCMAKKNVSATKAKAATEAVSKLGTVYFDFNKWNLKKGTTKMLDSLVSNVKNQPLKLTTIEINGYADSKGSKAYNLQLSRVRSIACKNYLIKKGLKNVIIKVKAFGSTPLFAANETEAERVKNRKVDIVVRCKKIA